MTPAPLRAEADWLELRGAADEEARDRGAAGLLQVLTESLAARGAHLVQVIDLGAGTGANRRYLQPRLPFRQQWVVVDQDAEHLRHPAHEGAVRVQAGIAELPATLERQRVPTDAVRLVTCAALLDVLTEDDVAVLAAVILDGRSPALLSLSVDGRVAWSPPDPVDVQVARSFDTHQQRDGRLGPTAARVLERLLSATSATDGLSVHTARTDWLLGPTTPRLLSRWLDERVASALEQEPRLGRAFTDWHGRRLAQLRAGQLHVRVGHVDLLAMPR